MVATGAIHTYALRATEVAQSVKCTTESSVWDATTSEDYMGKLYDKETGNLLWHTDNPPDTT